jgi:hypothetical protein
MVHLQNNFQHFGSRNCSKLHILEDRASYNSDTILDAIPFPWPPGIELKVDLRVEAPRKTKLKSIDYSAHERNNFADNVFDPSHSARLATCQ